MFLSSQVNNFLTIIRIMIGSRVFNTKDLETINGDSLFLSEVLCFLQEIEFIKAIDHTTYKVIDEGMVLSILIRRYLQRYSKIEEIEEIILDALNDTSITHLRKKKRIYADCNATIPMRECVRNSVMHGYFNPSALYQEGRDSRYMLKSTRDEIRNFLDQDYQISFIPSVTIAHNIIANSMSNYSKIISAIEHPSIMNSFRTDIVIEVDNDGLVKLDHLQALLLKHSPAVVSIMFANHETGAIQNIREIAYIVKEHDSILHSDLTQIIGKCPFSRDDLSQVDIVTFSGHKIGAGMGAAVLAYRESVHLQPMIFGGMQEGGLHAGTENVFAINALLLSIREVQKEEYDLPNVGRLRDHLEQRFSEVNEDIIIVSKNAKRLMNTSCIIHPSIPGEMQMMFFDLNGIAIGTGSACSSGKAMTSTVIQAMNFSTSQAKNMIRISINSDINNNDIEHIITVWKKMQGISI